MLKNDTLLLTLQCCRCITNSKYNLPTMAKISAAIRKLALSFHILESHDIAVNTYKQFIKCK